MSTPAYRPLTGGAARAAASQVVVAVGGALATLVVARLLGPAGAGAYAVALALLLGFMALGTIGLETGISYTVSSGQWDPPTAFRQTQLVALGLGLAAVAVGWGLQAAVPEAFTGLGVSLVLVTTAAMPFVLSWLYASYLSLALDHYETYALPPMVQALSALALVSGLAAIYGVSGAVVGLLLSHVATAAVVFSRARREAQRGPPAGRRAPETTPDNPLRAATRFGLQTYIANALGFVTYRLDLFILNAVSTAATVGRYSVAVAITSTIFLLPRGLSGVVLPRVAALSATNEASHRAMVETKSMRHVSLVVWVSAAALAAVLVLLVTLLFGHDFAAATELGLILLPGSALLGLSGVLSATVIGRGRPVYSLYNAAVSTPMAVALYLVMVPRWDATGAALASSILYTLSFFITAFFYRRVTGRSVAPLLVPTRSELEDYARFLRGVMDRVRRVRA